jgi:hypothetical protein
MYVRRGVVDRAVVSWSRVETAKVVYRETDSDRKELADSWQLESAILS